MDQKREHWSGSIGFIAASVGSAVGLGNIWKFPYMTGQNGGGAFVLIYLICIACIGIPILISEFYIGQKGQTDAATCFAQLNPKNKLWTIAGYLGVISAFIILSFYSVVTGWTLEFLYQSLTTSHQNISEDEVLKSFDALLANPSRMIFWHAFTMSLVIAIVFAGIKDGIEKCSKVMMPILVLFLIGLLIWSTQLDGFSKSIRYLFAPDFSKLNSTTILSAIGHSFFTLSLGIGGMITYGSYLKSEQKIVKTSIIISLADTLIALTAGLVIFAIVFSFSGIEPTSGPGLMFVTLPKLFHKIPYGWLVASIFFMLLSFAALTSAIAIFEVVVSFFITRVNISRHKLSAILGSMIFLVGLFSVFSFNKLSHFQIAGHSIFDFLDGITTNIFMPFGGILIALFMGWILGPKAIKDLFNTDKLDIRGHILLWSCRVIAPLFVLWVMIRSIIQWA